MEKAVEVLKNVDQRRLQTGSSAKGLGQNQQMAVGQQARGTICNEPAVVSGEGLDLLHDLTLSTP
jgi:hypothetical protein